MSLLNDFRNYLADAKSNFACGGDISIEADVENALVLDPTRQASCPPVTLRWDGRGINKISFPQSPKDEAGNKLSSLIAKGSPATFGRGGEDVLDESYRKAIKIDPTEFSSNFHPVRSRCFIVNI